jgi:hypothetical protein
MKTLKTVILNNTKEIAFGCGLCKEDEAITIEDVSQFTNSILTHLKDSVSEVDVRKKVSELIEKETGLKYPESMHLQKDIEKIFLDSLV